MIQLALEQDSSLRAIARRLERSVSTISRELARNGWRNPATRPRGPGRPPRAGGYRATSAHKRAQQLAAVPRCRGRLRWDGPLWPMVEPELRTKRSPEPIAGTLGRMHPNTPALRVSHETIYTAIYAMPRGALRTELVRCLRQGRKSRRPRTQGEDRRGQIPNMVNIHERPPQVKERLVPGHWEGDLIIGARNASAIGTLVERTSLFAVLVKMHGTTAPSGATLGQAASLPSRTRAQGFSTIWQTRSSSSTMQPDPRPDDDGVAVKAHHVERVADARQRI